MKSVKSEMAADILPQSVTNGGMSGSRIDLELVRTGDARVGTYFISSPAE